MPPNNKVVFVTVGTTSFDTLINSVNQDAILKVLQKQGYQQVIMQIGRGNIVPSESKTEGITTEYYRYKASIAEDIQNADLVISHAGAGSCLEVLAARKPLVVVINEDLMNNHQVELAEKLKSEGHIYCTNYKGLQEVLEGLDASSLKPLEPGRPEKFSSFLDRVMGVS